MRLVYEEYADGTHSLFETDDDGSNRRTLEAGKQHMLQIKRIIAFVTASFDENSAGQKGAMKAFEKLLEQVRSNGKSRTKPKKAQ